MKNNDDNLVGLKEVKGSQIIYQNTKGNQFIYFEGTDDLKLEIKLKLK